MASDGEQDEQIKELSSQVFRRVDIEFIQNVAGLHIKRKDKNKYEIVQWMEKEWQVHRWW